MSEQLAVDDQMDWTNDAASNSGHRTPNARVQSLIYADSQNEANWEGFCLIESEPAYFNVMLKEFGVRGIKVQELLSLDDFSLIDLPKPVYGIVFLSRYKEDLDNTQEMSSDGVWFANQIDPNACATVALINIINNIPKIDIGENLASFKRFTEGFTPYLRGLALANFEFIKNVHNSFARKSDKLNLDNEMRKEFEKSKKKRSTPSKQRKKRHEEDGDIGEFHFSAYMPIGTNIWKLDGLDSQPIDLGPMSLDWLSTISPMLTARMLEFADQGIEFNILALVRDPLLEHQFEFTKHQRLINAVDEKLRTMCGSKYERSDDLPPSEDSAVSGDQISLDISQEGEISNYIDRTLRDLGDETSLREKRYNVYERLRHLKVAIREEESLTAADQEKALDRRIDYTPAINKYLSFLAENHSLSADSHDLEYLIREYECQE